MKFRVLLIVFAVLALAGAAVYVQRKRATDALAPVQLGTQDGSSFDLAAKDPGVSGLLAAAADVRRAFEAGA
jgi:uncharacterized membrane protein